MSLIGLFRQQVRTYVYNPVYKGPFENKKIAKNPGNNRARLEQVMEEIKQIRDQPVKDSEVSPFHLVWRYKYFGGTWPERLVLKRLGLHSKSRSIPVVIPNTPHYNALLWEVKHHLRIKPLLFPNGMPSEEDIGSIRVDMNTGEMLVDRAFKIPVENLEKAEKPGIFSGHYMTNYLKWSSGVVSITSMPCHEVQQWNGSNLKELDKRMKNYYKHQHKFYSK